MALAISSVLGAVSWLRSAWVPWLLLLVACLVCMTGYALMSARLEAEVRDHALTKAQLEGEEAYGRELTTALHAQQQSTEAVQESLREALAREKLALDAAAARKRILDAIQTRKRTEAEKDEVVDDETRSSVADRINRPL